MRVVVTGGAGFIGRAVVERLASPRRHVVALVRDPSASQHIAHEGGGDGGTIELVPATSPTSAASATRCAAPTP